MGYEVKIYFISNYDGKPNDFHRVDAMIEMHKTGYDGPLCNLIHEISQSQKSKKEKYSKKIDEFRNMYNEMYNRNGDYTTETLKLSEVEKQKKLDEMYKIERELEANLPYFYCGEDETFSDPYGDLLNITDLKTLKDVLTKEIEIMKKDGETGYPYFKLALDLTNTFIKNFKNREIKVVLYGH